MKKIVIPHYNIFRLFVVVHLIPSLVEFAHSFHYLYVNRAEIRADESAGIVAAVTYISGPLLAISILALVANIWQGLEFIVLHPDKIKVYNFIIPTAVIEINSTPILEVEYSVTVFGRNSYKFFTIYGAGKDSKQNIRALCLWFYAAIRMCTRKTSGDSMTMMYDKNYVKAIEAYYNIEPTMIVDDPYNLRK